MVSPLAPISFAQTSDSDPIGSYLSGVQGGQKIQENNQTIRMNNQAIDKSDYEQHVARLGVANRIFTKAREIPDEAQRVQFMASLNDGMLASVGADKKTLSQTPLDNTSLDAAIAQTGNALQQHENGESALFDKLTKNMTPAEVDEARRIHLGMNARAVGSGAITTATTNGLTNKVAASEGAIELSKRNNQNTSDLNYKPDITRKETQAKADVELATKPNIEANTVAAKTNAEILAKNKAEGQVSLPMLEDTTKDLIKNIDELQNHPARKYSTGLWSAIPVVPGSPQADFQKRLDQIKGAGFLQAYNSLKGGGAGAITDIEGTKAGNAVNRIGTSTSDKEFDAAVSDFKNTLNQALTRARGKASDSSGKDSSGTNKRPPLSSFQRN